MNMLKNFTAGLAITALAVVPGQAQDSFRLAGDRVAVYNLAGEVQVVRGSGSQVVVQLMRGGADGDRLSVEVDPIQGREVLRVIYPATEIVYDRGEGGSFSSDVRVRSDGTFGGGDRGDRGDPVRVRSSGDGLEAWADLRIELPAGVDLQVWNAVGHMETSGTEGPLLLDTQSGRVSVQGHRGNLEVDTGSGSVQAFDVQGDVHIDTGSGSVRLQRVTGSSVLVDTGSGSVELTAINAADLQVDTGSGSVEAELTGRVDRVVVDTGSGGVTLRLPANLNAEIEADTGSGGIDVDFPVDVVRTSRDYFRGTVGEGRGTISVDTGSGRIRILGG